MIMNVINKTRNSSIELLRIICMFLIIAHHYVVHGDITFSFNDNIWAIIYLKNISSFGKSACSIFALITGYYMISANTKEKFYRKIVPTLFRMFFCTILVLIIVYISNEQLVLKDVVKQLLSLGNVWYMKTYVCFYFFIPYINTLLLKITKKEFQKYLLIVFIIFFIINTLTINSYLLGDFYFMLVMYSFGAYYRLYCFNVWKMNIKHYLYISLFFALTILMSNIIVIIIGFVFRNSIFLNSTNPLTAYSSLLSFGFSFFLFVYFCNIRIDSNIINLVASTIPSIYMVHDNKMMYSLLWLKWYPNFEYKNNPYFHSLIKIFLIFSIIFLLDIIRKALFYSFSKQVNTIVGKAADKINITIESKINN